VVKEKQRRVRVLYNIDLYVYIARASPLDGGHNTQFADYRAAGRFSAPRGETLLLFPPRHSKTFMASKRARGQSVCPWSPSQEGARGQGSSACRGTPSRGEARAIYICIYLCVHVCVYVCVYVFIMKHVYT
jgi:hypothetical protein